MSAHPAERRRAAVLLALAYLGFVSLGLPDGLLGAAWPAIRRELGLPLDGAGQVLLLATAGTVASSLLSGRLLARLSTGTVLAASTLLAASALILYAQAGGWRWLMVAALLAGLGGGAVDAALNGFVARHHSVRHMNWLHGCWGVGATGGPLMVAWVLGTDPAAGAWRRAYLALFLVELVLGLAFLATRRLWREDRPSPEAEPPAGPVEPPAHPAAGLPAAGPPGERARGTTGAMWASVLFFFCYTGVEAGAGLWGASLLVATRQASLPTASAVVALYWGLLTVGRFLFGAVAERIGPARLLGGCTVTALAALVLLSLPGTPLAVPAAALAVLGLALAPMYPLLMHDTPHRFGAARARHLVGFQVAAASLGIAILPWLVGLLARRTSLLAVPPALALLALGLVWLARRRARSG